VLAALLSRPTSYLVRASGGAVRDVSYHAPANQVQLCGVTTQPAASGRGGRHHNFTTGARALRRLKAELERQVFTSCQQRVRQLLSHEEMGDPKSSQFLRNLKGLAQTSQTNSFAPSGPPDSHHTCKPYVSARLRAV